MSADLGWMIAPVVACLLAMGALGWFGLHVLQRGIIFVDLALAQFAALGTTYAVFLGHDPDEPIALVMSLSFTALGAILFAAIRAFEEHVPQESLIGIAYAVSAALGVLLIELASDPHGAEKIQHLLVGNVVWVQWSEIAIAAAAIGGTAVLHALFGRRFLLISMDPEEARRRGLRVALWDLLFYLSFGVVLTSIVSIVGVLLVFSFLVIPAVIARLFAQGVARRLLLAWGVGLFASVAGVSVSYEHSTGPIVVTILGALLVLALLWVAVRDSQRAGRQIAIITASLAGIGLLLWGFAQVPSDHEHEAEHAALHADDLPPEAPTEAAPTDPLEQLGLAVEQARAGDPAGLVAMAGLVRSAPPFIRMEAHDRLARIAGPAAPAYDPLAGPDDQGLWAAWAASPPAGWQEAAKGLLAP